MTNFHIRIAAMGVLMAGIFMSTTKAATVTPPNECYVMHSSGNHIAKGSSGRALLESSKVESPQKMTFTPVDGADGFYTISSPDGGYLALQGSYNTSFIEDNTSSAAHFSIETVNNAYVRIKCRSNSKYLGTDDSSAGSYIYADKSGTTSLHYWYLSDNVDEAPMAEEHCYLVNPASVRQEIEGWGVSLCWWANMCGKWNDEAIDEIVDWLVSPDGLNFNIFRYNIGGGEDPDNTNCTPHHMGNGKGLRAEMEGFKDSSDGDYIWTRDESQRKIMLKIKEKRPDAIFEAFSNSAPWYMTYSGCPAGNNPSSKDNLKPEYYEEFAHYLVDVCKHYKDEYDIEFKTLDPFNEPMTSYWGLNGGQEGCHFDVSSMIAFIKVLSPILEESGLNTVISAADETSVAQSVTDFVEFRKAGILDLIGQFNTHTYTVTNKDRAKLSYLCNEEGTHLWMSEVGAGGSGLQGNLSMAEKVINDVRYLMPAAWLDWQYIEENNDQWCLVKVKSFETSEYERVKNFYVRSHFSRFIKAGYEILTTLDDQTLVARNQDGTELVIVAVNCGTTELIHKVDLSLYDSVGSDIEGYVTSADENLGVLTDCEVTGDKVLTFTMPSQSIVTLIVPVAEGSGLPNDIREDADYLIVGRIADKAIQPNDGKLEIADIDLNPSQLWHFTADEVGYRLSNKNGDIITSDNSYYLTTSEEEGEGQTFLVEALDGLHYKICTLDGVKGFDLEGESASSGTKVGVYNYAGDAPVHRQWLLFPVSAHNINLSVNSVNNDESEAPIKVIGDTGCLTVNLLNDADAIISVFSSMGVSLHSEKAYDNTLTFSLPKGVYVVSYQSNKTKYATTVLVK